MTADLDHFNPDADPAAERRRLDDRAARSRVLKDPWWAIVKDAKEMERSGHGALVRWARAGLGLDDRRTEAQP